MSLTEADRNEIFDTFKSHYGERIANNLMSMLPPVGWADVATKTDIRAVQTDIRSVQSELRAVEANLRTELHKSARSQTWALVAWTTGLVGLMAALVR